MSAGTLQVGAPADIVRRYKYAGLNHARRSAAWHSRKDTRTLPWGSYVKLRDSDQASCLFRPDDGRSATRRAIGASSPFSPFVAADYVRRNTASRGTGGHSPPLQICRAQPRSSVRGRALRKKTPARCRAGAMKNFETRIKRVAPGGGATRRKPLHSRRSPGRPKCRARE
jgi:hypothetical protein